MEKKSEQNPYQKILSSLKSLNIHRTVVFPMNDLHREVLKKVIDYDFISSLEGRLSLENPILDGLGWAVKEKLFETFREDNNEQEE